jgi:hypothetical protein
VVGLADRGELFVAFLQCPFEVQDGLALSLEFGVDGGGAGGGTEAAALERLLAEQFREALFQIADLSGEPAVLLVQVGVLG